MTRSFVATVPVLLGLAVSTLFAQQPQLPEQQQPARPAAPRLTLMEMVKRSVQRVGATVDATRSTPQMVVSSYGDPKGGKTTMVVVNDRTRNMLGLYVYNFGSLKDASNREEVYKYLLSANDAITIGAFFVDSEDDIGFKYLMNIGQSLNQASFESSYLMMAAVARDRKPEIRKLLGLSATKEDKPSDLKKAAEEKPPET
jgi:hypothetical protein